MSSGSPWASEMTNVRAGADSATEPSIRSCCVMWSFTRCLLSREHGELDHVALAGEESLLKIGGTVSIGVRHGMGIGTDTKVAGVPLAFPPDRSLVRLVVPRPLSLRPRHARGGLRGEGQDIPHLGFLLTTEARVTGPLAGREGPAAVAPATLLDAGDREDRLPHTHQYGRVHDAVLLGTYEFFPIEDEDGPGAHVLRFQIGDRPPVAHLGHGQSTAPDGLLEEHVASRPRSPAGEGQKGEPAVGDGGLGLQPAEGFSEEGRCLLHRDLLLFCDARPAFS